MRGGLWSDPRIERLELFLSHPLPAGSHTLLSATNFAIIDLKVASKARQEYYYESKAVKKEPGEGEIHNSFAVC